MRHAILVFALLIVAALAAGCTSTNEGSAVGPTQGKTMGERYDKAKTETKEADQGTQTTGDKIDRGLDRAGEELNNVGEEIEEGFDQAGEAIRDATD